MLDSGNRNNQYKKKLSKIQTMATDYAVREIRSPTVPRERVDGFPVPCGFFREWGRGQAGTAEGEANPTADGSLHHAHPLEGHDAGWLANTRALDPGKANHPVF
jgi:hypothetical protein